MKIFLGEIFGPLLSHEELEGKVKRKNLKSRWMCEYEGFCARRGRKEKIFCRFFWGAGKKSGNKYLEEN